MTRRSLFFAVGSLATAGPRIAGPALTASAVGSGLGALKFATGWLNGHETAASLHGRIVLVDVFTFECVNCTRVTPNLKRLYETYARTDLAIVAVHTPEVPAYQSRVAYLAAQARAARLPWPIAIDNAARIWDAYGVSAWPTQLVFDRAGRLRHTIVGDGTDGVVRAAVSELIRPTRRA